MDASLPGIVVTGASGFVGRNFVESVADDFRLFCLARRSPEEVGIQRNENIRWTQVDIADASSLEDVAQRIRRQGGADYILHLAGYYDFDQKDNPEYTRTNVIGTRNILNLGEALGIKRFLFASSLAACKFSSKGETVNEQTAAAADFPYARSKRIGEELMKEYSEKFPCSIVRLAAVYSDWCEYPPLFVFLKTWLSGKWDARILGGFGESSITYIHVQDLVKFFLKLITAQDSLPKFGIYIASPSGTISHMDLFRTASRYYYGRDIEPIMMPRTLSAIGLLMRNVLGKISGKPSFERLWMVKYIDKKLNIDSSVTQKTLAWQPVQRYHVLRRLLFLIEKMKHYPDEWNLRNEMLLRRITQRPNILIYNTMMENRQALVEKTMAYVLTPKRHRRFSHYQKMDKNLLKWYIDLFYLLMAATVRNRDRFLMRYYIEIIASRRFTEGFQAREVSDLLLMTGNIVSKELFSNPVLQNMEQHIYDNISLTIQLAVDEMEDIFDVLESRSPKISADRKKIPLPAESSDLKSIVRQLEDICNFSLEIPPDLGEYGLLEGDYK
ncbi:NAD(P)-dependent oxidoreductase [bacterium]|nr:NAD(P)-dependent oxidoreductase [bacterium]